MNRKRAIVLRVSLLLGIFVTANSCGSAPPPTAAPPPAQEVPEPVAVQPAPEPEQPVPPPVIDTVLPKSGDESRVLPAEYTVRYWDCLWNIAGKSWVYNDPWKWRILYEANKSKLSQPNNPDHLLPGTVLAIPSLEGETRQGAWEEGVEYPDLR